MEHLLDFAKTSIPNKWSIQNPFIQSINQQNVTYKIIGSDIGSFSEAIFYCHGLGGSIDDCPEINQFASIDKPIIRVSAYGLKSPQNPFHLPIMTFGDICTLLYNSRQAIIGIADKLKLSKYQIYGHSWGGFHSLLTALQDSRCQKCMLLVSTPDICDAITRMGNLVFNDHAIPEIVRLITSGVSWDAHSAKFGKAVHQKAWNEINPYKQSNNPDLELFIFNRKEDRTMRKKGVLHFIDICQKIKIANAKAKFVFDRTKEHHDMPFKLFHNEMSDFLDLS